MTTGDVKHVWCVIDPGSSDIVEYGIRYKATEIGYQCYALTGLRGTWNSRYFIGIEPFEQFSAIAIRDEGPILAGGEYTFVRDLSGGYFEAKGLGYSWYLPGNFDMNSIRKLDDAPRAAAPRATAPLDDEARYRKLLCPRIAPHECPCGIPRVVCSYHA